MFSFSRLGALLVGSLVVFGSWAACGADSAHEAPAPQPTAPQPAAPQPATPQPTSEAGDTPLGTISSRGKVVTPVGAPPAGETSGDPTLITAPGARFRLPAGWVRENPSSSMRLAQARIDGPAGPAALTVFFFGPGGGGGVDANLDRWIGQVDASGAPRRESFAVGGFQVTWIEVDGTLKPSTMGTGPSSPQPDSRLLGAVVEGPGGPWFFKATGPAATLEAARDDFLAMLRSVEAS